MEVYVEITYITNLLLILVSLEMMAILLVKELSYLQVIKQTFILSSNILLLYFDNYGWLLLVVWLIVFYIFYRKQVFIFFPIFIFIYFSLLYFTCSLLPEAFVYNGVLITPLSISSLAIIIVSIIMILINMMFIIYLKRIVRINNYLYQVIIKYNDNKYYLKGFLDSGNEVYYQGYPLILIQAGIIKDIKIIDKISLDDIRSDEIEIIKVNYLQVNEQLLDNVYMGVINNIEYDCLLNKSLMGGII